MNQVPRNAIWVRFPRFIGDSVMIHQALEPLRNRGVQLVAWGPAFVMELFEGTGCFAGVSPDRPEKASAWALRRLLRSHAAVAVINLPRSSRALLAAWLARVPIRVGWQAEGGGLLASHSLPFLAGSTHQLLRYRALLEKAFPGLPEVPVPPFKPRLESLQSARLALEGLHLPQQGYIVLGLGAMAWQKRLGTSVWVGLIERLRLRGVPHVLVGGTGPDQAQAAEILQSIPGIPDLTGCLPLSATAAVIAGARALVGNDSALGHLAAVCRTPAVLAFGPTRPEFTAPVGTAIRVIRKEGLACLGCLGGCDIPGHPCMQQLDPEALWRALAEFLVKG